MRREEGDLNVIDDGATVQVSLHRVALPGLFVVFPSAEKHKALGWVRSLALRDDLKPNTDITRDVPGALAAGVMPTLKMHLGKPEIKYVQA